MKLLLLGLALTMTAVSAPANNYKVNAAVEGGYVLSDLTKNTLSKYALIANESATVAENALLSWMKDANYSKGISLYNTYAEGMPLINDAIVRQVKDSFYVMGYSMDYMFNYETSCVDEIRCLLDHTMAYKDELNFFVSLISQSTLSTSDKSDLFESGRNLYGFIKSCCEETFMYMSETNPEEAIPYEENFEMFNEHMHTYLVSSSNKQIASILNPYYTERYENFVSKLIKFCGPCEDSGRPANYYNFDSAAIDYINNDSFAKLYNQEIIGFPEQTTPYEDLDDNAKKSLDLEAKTGGELFLIDLYMKLSTYMNSNIATSVNASAFNNNSGPLMYKVLDLIEAMQWADSPNIMILCNEIIEDLYMLLDCCFVDSGKNDLLFEKNYYQTKIALGYANTKNGNNYEAYNEGVSALNQIKLNGDTKEAYNLALGLLQEESQNCLRKLCNSFSNLSEQLDINGELANDSKTYTTYNTYDYIVLDSAQTAINDMFNESIKASYPGRYGIKSHFLKTSCVKAGLAASLAEIKELQNNDKVSFEVPFFKQDISEVKVWMYDETTNKVEALSEPNEQGAASNFFRYDPTDRCLRIVLHSFGNIAISYIDAVQEKSEFIDLAKDEIDVLYEISNGEYNYKELLARIEECEDRLYDIEDAINTISDNVEPNEITSLKSRLNSEKQRLEALRQKVEINHAEANRARFFTILWIIILILLLIGLAILIISVIKNRKDKKEEKNKENN